MAIMVSNPVFCMYTEGTPPQTYCANYLVYDKLIKLFYQSESDINNYIYYLTSISKKDGIKETHVFDNANGETLTTDYSYFIEVTDLEANVVVTETRLYGTVDAPHQKVYGVCEDKCRVEVPTKAEFDSSNTEIDKAITNAVNEFNEFTDRIVKVDSKTNTFLFSANKNINCCSVAYPEGFTNKNCVPVAIIFRDNLGRRNVQNIPISNTCVIHMSAELNGSDIDIYFENPTSTDVTKTDAVVSVILYRYA